MVAHSFQEGLKPLAVRYNNTIREHEIMRVSASIGGKNFSEAAEIARREILFWAQNRCGGVLPPEAWSFENFEFLSGGRNSVGIRILSDTADLWALRADDPDKIVPGRVWTTEVVIGSNLEERPRFSARLLVGTPEQEMAIEPHSPGFIRQIVEKCGLYQLHYDLDLEPNLISSVEDAHDLIDMLVSPERELPVFVLTVADDSGDPNRPMIDAVGLAKAVLGLAHVVIVPAEYTWPLTERLGRVRSVFGGAVRSYLPGFNEAAHPFDHRLVLAEQLISEDGKARCTRWLRQIAATESVRNRRLGRDVVAFAAVRNASLRAKQEMLAASGASDAERLVAAEARITALEKEVQDERAAQEYFDTETRRAEERANASEEQYRASVYRIQELQERLRLQTGATPEEVELPTKWEDFASWCDVKLAGRVAITQTARRNLRSPEFADVSVAARSLKWLADDYRNGRISGSASDFRDFPIEPGLRNAPCGGDEFEFEWQGRRHTADWHIKNGGNTRDPKRCLRIYFAWEPETQQVIVADMPAHRDTALS